MDFPGKRFVNYIKHDVVPDEKEIIVRVLITGITSFLGLYTAKLLLREGHEVIGAVRPGSRRASELDAYGITAYPTYRTVHLDLSELPAPELGEAHYAQVMGSISPLLDAWVHFAWDGVGSAGRSDTNIQIENVQNAKKAYLYAKLLGARKFLFAGSQAEYGTGNHRVPMPVSPYGKAKLAFGRWATEQSLLSEIYDDTPMQFIHMRIYSVYGKGDHETSLVNTVLKAALHHEAITLGPCTQRWNYLEVHDLARAIRILLVSEDTRTDVYDIAGSDSRALKKYVIAMNSIAGKFAAVNNIALSGASVSSAAFETSTESDRPHASSSSDGAPASATAATSFGADLQFGTRANNAEGAADMSPEILKLQRIGFHQEISFEAGIGMLLKEMCRSHA